VPYQSRDNNPWKKIDECGFKEMKAGKFVSLTLLTLTSFYSLGQINRGI